MGVFTVKTKRLRFLKISVLCLTVFAVCYVGWACYSWMAIEKDYVALYNESVRVKGVTVEENGFTYCRKAMDELTPLDDDLVRELNWGSDFEWLDYAEIPEPLLPRVEFWIESNESSWTLFAQAANMPFFWVEYENLSDDLLFSQQFRLFMDYRCEHLKRCGEIELLTSASLDLMKFANQLIGKGRFLDQFVGMSMYQDAIGNISKQLSEGNYDFLTLKNLRDEINSIPPVSMTCEDEYYCLMSIIDTLYIGEHRPYMMIFGSRAGVEKRVKQEIERAEIDTAKPYYEDDRSDVNMATPFFMRDTVLAMLLPVFGRAEQFVNRGAMHHDALLTMLSLEIYKVENGIYPDSLLVLVNEGLIDEIPEDMYSFDGLKYHVDEDSYTLYSIGRDLEDDGGKERPEGDDCLEAESYDYILWPVNDK